MAPPTSTADSPNAPFPVVGVGGSAGSLEPLRTFLGALPEHPGVALVVVTHHPPGEHSLLPDLLADRSPLPVHEAADGLILQPDNVYVALPDGEWLLREGRLVQQPTAADSPSTSSAEADQPPGPRHPVDTFFRSLAAERGNRGIGVVLSGTGTDGTLGIKAIKSQAGMAMAQDPDTAEFGGMPASAMATNLVDYALSPAELPATLVAYVQAQDRRQVPPEGRVPEVSEDILGTILSLVSEHTGHDFSGYKRSTLIRRLERRMNLHRIEDPGDYVRFLRANPAERDLLFKEVIISVTNFFRNPTAWDALGDQVLGELLGAAAAEQRPFRAWVVGCATGEEAYSLAILVSEYLEAMATAPQVQIFATDVDQEAIESARVGRFPAGIGEDVGERRLRRHFVAEGDTYRVVKGLRDMVIFAEHNALQDPPFTRLDLISCRNLLIYLDRDLQKRLLPLFRYALHGNGILFLGPSETPDELTESFTAVDKSWRIYRVAGEPRAGPLLDLPARGRGRSPTPMPLPGPAPGGTGEAVGESFTHSVTRLLASEFAPPAVLVNDRAEVLYVHGRTGQFLEPASGPAQTRLLDMARPGLRAPLGQALREVASGAEAIERTVDIQADSGTETVRLEVLRIRTPKALRGFRLVAFRNPEPAEGTGEGGESATDTSATAEAESRSAGERVARLERQLESTRQDKQVAVEELQSMNEELQSMNEELQSSNEELEVSKEEVESLNEELRSVNSELEARVSELSEANDDLKNLLDSTDIATLFLDEDLRIKRFTEAARELIALRDSDVGRPVDELRTHLRYQGLAADGEAVLDSLKPREVEVQAESGHWYLLRIMPYRTTQNVIKGLVCTFQDIQSAKRLERSEAFFRAIVDTVREPLLVLDPELRVVSANDGFYRSFPYPPESVAGVALFRLGDGQLDHPELRTLLREVLPRDQAFRDFELTVTLPELGERRLLLNGRELEVGSGEEARILLTMAVQPDEEGADHGGER